jgi:hypothetical protein
LQKIVEADKKQRDQIACFKATPVKMKKDVVIPERVKSEKKPTKAVEISLASNQRSVKRELFDSAMKEKERV